MTTQATFTANASWQKVWNFATQGAFTGVIQQTGGTGNLIYHIKSAAPADGDGGLIATINPTAVTMTQSGENLWVRTGGGEVKGILNPVDDGAQSVASIDTAIGGANAAAAGNTGASTTNGFLRWIRDKLNAITHSGSIIVSAPTMPYVEDWNAALTATYQKVATTTTSTKSFRMSCACNATAYDIEYQVVAAGGAVPTTAGQALLAGDDFLAGIPVGDIYARSATLQKLIVWRA